MGKAPHLIDGAGPSLKGSLRRRVNLRRGLAQVFLGEVDGAEAGAAVGFLDGEF